MGLAYVNIYRLVFLLMLSISCVDTYAQSSIETESKGIMIVTFDCGEWVTARRSGPAESIKLRGFVVGYINGLSLGRPAELWSNEKGEVSQEQVFLWIDKWCEENPLESLNRAIFEFAKVRSTRFSAKW
jgi:hypothetical protein